MVQHENTWDRLFSHEQSLGVPLSYGRGFGHAVIVFFVGAGYSRVVFLFIILLVDCDTSCHW
jgi:hypothetical protein